MAAGSAGVAHASVREFSGRVPRVGSVTFTPQYRMSSFTDINVKMKINPHDIDIKPVKCSDLTNISGYKRITANNKNQRTIATGVKGGTCFRLNVDAPTTAYFDIKGDVKY
jgi:hypothetical protein